MPTGRGAAGLPAEQDHRDRPGRDGAARTPVSDRLAGPGAGSDRVADGL
ncbi:hypothetical protein [Kitasatospora sp. NPDC093102]